MVSRDVNPSRQPDQRAGERRPNGVHQRGNQCQRHPRGHIVERGARDRHRAQARRRQLVLADDAHQHRERGDAQAEADEQHERQARRAAPLMPNCPLTPKASARPSPNGSSMLA
jgi:hypothetical protein